MLGPHEGFELELMLAGDKPMAFFWHEADGADLYPRQAFEAEVAAGRLLRFILPGDGQPVLEWIWYCQPKEAWRGELARRMQASVMAGEITDSASIETYHRISGHLLGSCAVDVHDHDRGPVRRQRPADAGPNAAGPASHNGDLSCECVGHALPPPVSRGSPHLPTLSTVPHRERGNYQ